MAGADIVLAPADTEAEVTAIAEAVRTGRFPADQLRDRVGRVLFHKYMMARDNSITGNIGDVSEAERIIKLLR